MIRAPEELDEQIARDWPEKWTRANDPNRPGASKRRNNIRRAYREAQAFKAWRAKRPNASCAGCANVSTLYAPKHPLTCDLEATGGSCMPVAADHVCMSWRRK